MKYRNLVGVAALSSLIFAACGTSGGDSGGGAEIDVENSLIATQAIAPGDACEAGGTMVLSGIDVNGNGTLEEAEGTDSYNICNGASTSGVDGSDGAKGDPGTDAAPGAIGPDGIPVLTTTSVADLSDCPEGGVVTESGSDDDLSGTLEVGEVDTAVTLCNGPPGPDACPAVMRLTPVGASPACPAGGVQIASGADTGLIVGGGGAGGAASASACDGILTPGEEQASQVVCTGVDGADGNTGTDGTDGNEGDPGTDGTDGTNGFNQLIKVTTLVAPTPCANGGFTVERGLDDNRDGSLDVGEVDYTVNMCTASDIDGDGIDNDNDNCVGERNYAQIDQDGDGEGDACDTTPCVGACDKNCSELLEKGMVTSGEYAIDPRRSGTPIMGYCDMVTDGGGWTLVLNYAHKDNTNPALQIRTTDLPLLNPTTTLGTDESGTAYWGHTSNVMFAAVDADEIRFWSNTETAGNLMHFRTKVCIPYFETGAGSCDGIQTGFTTLAGHNAALPGAAADEWINQGDIAMTNFPFWLGGTYHWGIRGGGNRWESDNFPNGSQLDTWHQIWARSTAPEAGYKLLYEYELPVAADINNLAQLNAITTVNNSAALAGASYGRVAFQYILNGEWVWTSMNDFGGGNVLNLGVPVDNVYDQAVTNLNVFTNTSNVTPVAGSATGKVEFWSNCYTEAPTAVFDYDDTISGTDCYGSMQVHNGTNTMWAYNRWAGGGTSDMGIGNSPSGHPDWTFRDNAATYARRVIRVYIQPNGSCAEIKANNPAATNGSYTVDPDGPGGNAPITAYCDMTTDGGGYTSYAITGTGTSTSRFDQANSCQALGMELMVVRTQAHYNTMKAQYNDPVYWRTIQGVYKTTNGGDYRGCAMNSTSASTCSTDWKAIDGGAWWIRNAPYSEPNGDYTAGCWLGTDNQFPDARFNDGNCGYSTGTSYICSTNDK